MRIPLTRYGRREILIFTAVCAALAAVALDLFAPAAALPVAVWLLVLAFFRDPQRRPDEPDALLAPADGTVVDISPVPAGPPLGEPGRRIGIFMSLWDVHVNRSPCAATVTRIERSPGGYLDARRAEAGERNESATIVLSLERGGRRFALVVRQVAGLIARRIVTDLTVGQVLAAGERIGMIKFGSRVEMLAGESLGGELAVRIGQSVRAGKSVLLRLPPSEQKA
jgi:phosphatidylserine decarboxylase